MLIATTFYIKIHYANSIFFLDLITPKNANFLIKEGEKVKKLPKQYVETA